MVCFNMHHQLPYGKGGRSTSERGVGVPGRGGLGYLEEGGWSTWERGVGDLTSEYVTRTMM